MIVGYARTSTSDQTAGLEAQARNLKAAGTEKVFSEQISSTAPRVKLTECLAFLREGDVLTVTTVGTAGHRRQRARSSVYRAVG